ncbi:FkbM family methyltransferase [Candidatus Babeliales bacterium]|nr:FkbM family methyltransferase [Candidatus Babeliales bacterium]
MSKIARFFLISCVFIILGGIFFIRFSTKGKQFPVHEGVRLILSKFNTINHIIHEGRVYKENHKGFPSSTSFIWDYFKLQLKTHLISSNREVEGEFLEFKIHGPNFGIISFLVGEIFFKREYYFYSNKINPFIIDCGSNIGVSVLFFKLLYPNSKILAFEPDKKAFELLKRNVTDNNLSSVFLENKALSNKKGFLNFSSSASIDKVGVTMRLVDSGSNKNIIKVPAVTLSDYISEEVDLLKMDIEGAETSVIEELSQNNKLRNIKKMIIEYHHHIKEDEDSMSSILSLLEKNGFGYGIEGTLSRLPSNGKYQDIMIYAYRK